jgi:hypothetical protein
MKRKWFRLTGTALLFPLFAICADIPPVIMIGREALKEGRSAAHEKVEADWARAMRRAKFPYHWIGMNAMTGPGEAWFISAYPSFAAMEDADKQIDKSTLKGEIEQLDARDGELRSASRSMMAIYRKDMSYRPDQANLAKMRYMGLTTFHVRLGSGELFREGGKKFVSAYDKSNFPLSMLAYQVIGGVPEGTYLFFTPMESLKSMDSMPQYERAMVEAMGSDEMSRMMKSEGQVFSSVDSSFFRINPMMSYVSKETEDIDPAFWRPKPMGKPASPAADSKSKEKAGQ